jgi:hypothetical protein
MVQHNKYFTLTIEGREYRARFRNYGYSYATLEIARRREEPHMRYIFWGPLVYGWKTLTRSSRDAEIGWPIHRRLFYRDSDARNLVTEVVRELSHVHKKSI